MGGSIEATLLQYGLAGVVIIGLTFAVSYLWRDNKALQDKIYALQEARRQDAQDNLDKVAEPLQVSGEAMQMFMGKIAESRSKRK